MMTASRFGRDLALMTEGESDGGRRQCGRVIVAVANEQGGARLVS